MVEILDYTEPATADNFYTLQDILGPLFNSNPMTSPNVPLIRPTINDGRGQGLDRVIRQLPSRFREITEQAERASPQRIGKKARKNFRKAMDRAEKWHQGIASLPQVPAFAVDPRLSAPVANYPQAATAERAVVPASAVVDTSQYFKPRSDFLIRPEYPAPNSPGYWEGVVGPKPVNITGAEPSATEKIRAAIGAADDLTGNVGSETGTAVIDALKTDLRPTPAGLVTTGPGSYYERGAVKLGKEPEPKSWSELGRMGRNLLGTYSDYLDYLTGTTDKDVIGDVVNPIFDAVGTLIGGDGKKKKTKAAPSDESDIIKENALYAAIDAKKRQAAEDAAIEDAEIADYKIPELSIDDLRKTVDEVYGDVDFTTNPKQDIADANAARDAERTSALAQLALAGGLMKSAGKSWEGAGEGFIGAAAVYDKGFQRYQNALQDSADRYGRQVETQRAFDLAKRGAVMDMWTQGKIDERALATQLFTLKREDLKDARTAARDLQKQNTESIREYYKNWLTSMKGDLEGADPAEVAKVLKLEEMALRIGRVIPPQNAGIDVADKD